MGAGAATFYITSSRIGDRYRLASRKPRAAYIEQTVDLADRSNQHNNHYYPNPIVEDRLDGVTELVFAGEPLKAPRVVSGSFTGELVVTINKQDFDAGVARMRSRR